MADSKPTKKTIIKVTQLLVPILVIGVVVTFLFFSFKSTRPVPISAQTTPQQGSVLVNVTYDGGGGVGGQLLLFAIKVNGPDGSMNVDDVFKPPFRKSVFGAGKNKTTTFLLEFKSSAPAGMYNGSLMVCNIDGIAGKDANATFQIEKE